jgi:hypothetical protein
MFVDAVPILAACRGFETLGARGRRAVSPVEGIGNAASLDNRIVWDSLRDHLMRWMSRNVRIGDSDNRVRPISRNALPAR